MNNSFQRLLDGVVNTLRKEVLPRIDDDFVRGQTYGAIYVLNQLKARGDWSVKYLGEQVAAQKKMFEEVASIAQDLPMQPPAGPSFPTGSPITAGELEQLREQGNRAICRLLEWLAAKQPTLAADKRGAIEAAIRRGMRAEIDIEMANTAKSMFAEISLGTESETIAQTPAPNPQKRN